MKILILGVYYSNNLGDGVICECVQFLLHRQFPAAELHIADLLDRHQFEPERDLTSLKQLRRDRRRIRLRRIATRWLHWDKTMKDAENMARSARPQLDRLLAEQWDLVVIAGGQLLMDKYALVLAELLTQFSTQNVPVVLNACGIGPMESAAAKRRLFQVLEGGAARSISCREPAEGLTRLGLCVPVRETADPALWSAQCYSLPTGGKSDGLIGLGVMYVSGCPEHTVVRFWKQVVRELERRGRSWKFFVNGSAVDTVFAQHIFSRLALSGRFEDYCAPQPERPEELVRMIAGFSSILSFRLHSHIIAASLNIPSAAVVWDEKVRAFFQQMGCPERCCEVTASGRDAVKRLLCAEREGVDQAYVRRAAELAAAELARSAESVGKA